MFSLIGCRIEQLQLETAERIKKALATYAIVAWRLLWLTYQARQNPELPCDTILETHEWQSLYCHFHGSPPYCFRASVNQASCELDCPAWRFSSSPT